MDLILTGCGAGRRTYMAKKIGLTDKVTEYIQTSLLPEIVLEDLAVLFKSKPSNILRVLRSLEKKNLVTKANNHWLRVPAEIEKE
jgi:DNA-binding MarR family transcriptional regulator